MPFFFKFCTTEEFPDWIQQIHGDPPCAGIIVHLPMKRQLPSLTSALILPLASGKYLIQRRVKQVVGVVADGFDRQREDDFKDMSLAEACLDEV